MKRPIRVNDANVKEENHVLWQLEKNLSSWYRIKRVLAIIKRVIKQKSFSHVNVAVENLQEADKLIIKWVQNKAFEEQLNVLKDLGECNKDTSESDMRRKKFLKKSDILV